MEISILYHFFIFSSVYKKKEISLEKCFRETEKYYMKKRNIFLLKLNLIIV